MKKRKAAPPEAPQDPRDMILDMLRTKSGMKQDVYARTVALFGLLKSALQEVANDLAETMATADKRIGVKYTDKGEMACELKVAGDTIIFHMHTNVFKLDQTHSLWKTSYMAEDELRGYFGVINMYNFLSDSFKYNRERDLGYMVARIFLNKDGHFFVQGKRQLGFDRVLRSATLALTLKDGVLVGDQSGGRGVCTGDSGGPAFRAEGDIIRVSGVLIGVSNSRSATDFCRGKAWYVPIARWTDWLVSAAKGLGVSLR